MSKKLAMPFLVGMWLVGCGPSSIRQEDLTAENTELKKKISLLTKEVDRLEKQVIDLSNTPQKRLEKITSLVVERKINEAGDELFSFKEKFPNAKEVALARKIIDDAESKMEKEKEALKTAQSLGFKAIKPEPVQKVSMVTVSVGVPSVSKRFVFDRYGNSYHYLDADRDSRFISANLSVTAQKGIENPFLPGFALYAANGHELERIQTFRTRFQKWEDYATYLGNYHDSRNDFTKSQTVHFSIGAQVSDEHWAKRPLYIVVSDSGCLGREEESFRSPPVHYAGSCQSLERSLSLETILKGNAAKIVRRID